MTPLPLNRRAQPATKGPGPRATRPALDTRNPGVSNEAVSDGNTSFVGLAVGLIVVVFAVIAAQAPAARPDPRRASRRVVPDICLFPLAFAVAVCVVAAATAAVEVLTLASWDQSP